MSGAGRSLRPLFSSFAAIAVALLIGGIFLELNGKDALEAYRILFRESLGDSDGRAETLKRMAPLLIVGSGLLIALRSAVWNIGIDGQFAVAALTAAVIAPELAGDIPDALMWMLVAVSAMCAGLLWAIPAALLRSRYGLNEIITTLMMNYIAFNLTAWLAKGPLRDTSRSPAQTEPLAPAHRLADIPGLDVHIGLLVGLLTAVLVAMLFTRTTLGYMLRMMGRSRAAALHAGLPVAVLTTFALLASGAMAGLAGANDVLGVQGVFRAGFNPGYGFSAFALVYLARFRPAWLIPFAFFLAALLVGGDLMPRRAGIPTYFVEMLEGLMLLCFGVASWLEKRWIAGVFLPHLGGGKVVHLEGESAR